MAPILKLLSSIKLQNSAADIVKVLPAPTFDSTVRYMCQIFYYYFVAHLRPRKLNYDVVN